MALLDVLLLVLVGLEILFVAVLLLAALYVFLTVRALRELLQEMRSRLHYLASHLSDVRLLLERLSERRAKRR